MTEEEIEMLSAILDELKMREQADRYKKLFADAAMYPKHNLFFEAGAKYRQRLLLGANRVGKSMAGLCEVVCHLTGDYPDWWKGKRFTAPNHWWLVGIDSKLVNVTLQPYLLGDIGDIGTGLIPSDKIDFSTLKDAKKAGTGLGIVRIKHSSGGYSSIEFKSAASGRKSFQGTAKSIYLDEECPYDVYEECLLRTMTGDNILMMTFTPLMGLTQLLQNYYGGEFRVADGEISPGKHAVNVTWDDSPHLSAEVREELYNSLPPHQREARTKGIPSLGAGLIYPVPESSFVIDPFSIPKHYKKLFALDVGWKTTAACWGAIDPESDVLYIYDEHYLSEAQPVIHADSIKRRGAWIPGEIDSAANGRSQIDGQNLMDIYRGYGLKLHNADKAVEAGIYSVWERMAGGRLKVFSSCQNLLRELRIYRRNDKGQIVKEFDHLCLTGDTIVYHEILGPARIDSLVGTTGRVLSLNNKYEEYVAAKMVKQQAQIVKIFLEDGTTIKATPDHKFLTTENKWVEARDLLNLRVKTTNSTLKVIKITVCHDEESVYCLEVPSTHCFAVGESMVISHNCDSLRYLTMGLERAATEVATQQYSPPVSSTYRPPLVKRW